MRRLRRWFSISAVVVLIVTACSGSQSSPPPTVAPRSPTATPQPGFSVSTPTAGPAAPATATPSPQPGFRVNRTPTAGAPTSQPTVTPAPTQTSAGPPPSLPTPTATPPPVPTIVDVSCPDDGHAAAPSPSQTTGPAAPANETRLSIDGKANDWAGRPLLLSDPVGDAEGGFPDLAEGRAFVNDHALYLLVSVRNPDEEFDSFQIDFDLGAKRYQVSWGRDWNDASIADVTEGWEWVRDSRYSSFAMQGHLEARIDLRDLDSPSSVRLLKIETMVGECCGESWRSADQWAPTTATVRFAEVDPPWRLALTGSALETRRMLSAPDRTAISVDFDPGSGRTRIVGGSGAVPSDAVLLVGNLELNDFVNLRAGQEGRFETDVIGFPGTHIMIKHDVTGQILRPEPGRFDENIISPGIVVRLPVEPAESGVAFGSGARMCCDEDSPTWTIAGSFERDALEPEDELQVSGRVSILAGPSASPRRIWLQFDAAMLGDAGGRQVGRAGKWVTPFLTATGLPIERELGGIPLGPVELGGAELRWRFEGERWVADFRERLRVPSFARTGTYVLMTGGLWGLEDAGFEAAGIRPFIMSPRDGYIHRAVLGSLTIGDPKPIRLSTTLLADELSEGSRGGVLAREDRGLFDITPRAMTRHDPVIPRLDPYGDRLSYRLEPYAPMLDVVDRSMPAPPAVPLDFSASSLKVTVLRPDGRTDVLGPSAITRNASQSPRTPWNGTVGSGGGELREIMQLQGDGDTFAYEFPTDGDYAVTLSGRLHDAAGRVLGICGTYDVTVANVLDIETAMLPGTPFEVGDEIAPTLRIMPGFAADVTYTVTHVGADLATTAQTFTGRANRYGWWDGDGAVLAFQRDGEYRVDVEARYTDPAGNLWVGRQRFGSAVATPNAPLIAHGRRGADTMDFIPPQWGFERNLTFEPGATAPHMHLPYFTGDVLWGSETDKMDAISSRDAVVTHTSVQFVDEGHPLVERALAHVRRFDGTRGRRLRSRCAPGRCHWS